LTQSSDSKAENDRSDSDDTLNRLLSTILIVAIAVALVFLAALSYFLGYCTRDWRKRHHNGESENQQERVARRLPPENEIEMQSISRNAIVDDEDEEISERPDGNDANDAWPPVHAQREFYVPFRVKQRPCRLHDYSDEEAHSTRD